MHWWKHVRRLSGKSLRPTTLRHTRPLARLESLEDRLVPAPAPALTGLAGTGSTQMLLGETVTYNFNFVNNDLTDTGFSPFLEVALDTSGPDGATSAPLDGFGTPSVTAAGLQMAPIGTIPLSAGQTTYTNPFTGQSRPVPTGFGANDTIYVYQLPFGSFTPGQSTAVTLQVPTSNLADVGTALPISIVPGFRDTDAVAPFSPVYGSNFNTDATPALYRLRKVYLGPESETATGPNFVRRYRLEVDIATGQTLTNLALTDTLAASMQILGRNTTVVAGNPNMAAYLYATAGNQGSNLFSSGNLTGTAQPTGPGGTLVYTFPTKTGVDGVDAAFEFNFYVPRDNASPPGGQVVPQTTTTGTDSTNATNTASAQANWNPLDTRDQQNQIVTPAAVGSVFSHTLEQQSIAVQKTVEAIDPTTGATTTTIRPGRTLLRYTINFQVSDYYAFQDVFVRDVLSDGLRLFIGTRGVVNAFPSMAVTNAYLTGTPSGSRTDTSGLFQGTGVIDYQRRYTSGDVDSDPTSFPADGPALGAFSPGVFTNLTPAPNTNVNTGGTSLIQFNISEELQARLGANAGRLVGGEIGNNGTGPFNNAFGSQLVTPGTTGTIVFYAEVSEEFSDAFPSGDRSVDQGDVLNNSVDDPTTGARDGISGTQLRPSTINDVSAIAIGTGSDNSSSQISIPYGQIDKQIHAINGVVVPAQTTGSPPLKIQPGDRVTYRLTYTLPISSFEQLRLIEFPPLPVMNVTGSAPFTFVRDPAAYTFQAGQVGVLDAAGSNATDDTYFATFDPTQTGSANPTLSINSTDNTLTMDFGSREDLGQRRSTQISLLTTFVVSNDPFVNDLFLTNQLRVQENSTNAGSTTNEDLNQFELVRPFVSIQKGAVAGDATGLSAGNIVFAAATNPTGTLTIGGNPLSGSNTLNSTTQAGLIGGLNITATNAPVDAGDIVRYAIVVQNTGDGDAFDVSIRDQIQPGYVIPGTFAGLNLRAFRGDGSPLVLGTDYTLTSYNSATGEFVLQLVDNYTAGNIGGASEDARSGALSRGASATGAITNGSNTVLLLYDLTLASTVAPNASITNTATVPVYSNNEAGPDLTDPNVVPDATDPTDTANVVTRLPGIAKVLTGTEVNEVGNLASTQATIGELITYTVTLTVREGVMPATRIVDTMDTGLAFARLVSVTSSAGVSFANSFGTLPSQTPTNVTFANSGRDVTFNFGDVTNTNAVNGTTETIVLVYEAVVLNTVGNQANGQRNNSARLSWTGNATTVATVSAANVTIVEPTLSTTKLARNATHGSAFASTTFGDSADLIEYQITITNGNASSDTTAFDVTLNDVIPALLTSPTLISATSTGGVRINGTAGTVGLSDLQLVGNTLTIGSNIDMPRNSTITIVVQGTFTGATGLRVPNTADVRWTSLDGTVTDRSVQNTSSEERDGSGGVNDYFRQSTANIETPPLVRKSIIATSEAHTSGSSVAVGEIVRYRLLTTIGEGITNNFQMQDILPAGMAFLNDGTARYVFVASANGNITSNSITNITGLGSSPTVVGDETNVYSVLSSAITGVFNDNNIATSANGVGTGESTTFSAGQSVFFRFGDLQNNDSDLVNEFILVEFNALVVNVTGNQAGTNLDNTFSVLADTNGDNVPGYLDMVVDVDSNGVVNTGDTSSTAVDADNSAVTTPNTPALSNAPRVTVAEPSLSVNKQVIATTGGVVTYRVTVSNASGTNFTTAFNTRVLDALDGVNLSLVSGSISAISFTGGASGVTENSSGNTVDRTITTMPAGSTATFTYQANVLTIPSGSTTLNNTVNVSYTSLPGSNGTGGTWTADPATSSTVPGAASSSTGERTGVDGAGQLNDYVTSDTERLGSLGDRVWVDLNSNGVQNTGEPGIVNAPVTVRWAGPNGTFNDGDDSVISTFTDSTGTYLVGGLPVDSPGAFRVTVDTTASVFTTNNLTTQTFDADGTGTPNQSQVSLVSATPNPRTQDFGYRGPGSIGDTIFLDVNNNGLPDTGEGIANVQVSLTGDFNGDGIDETVTTTTDTNGAYLFSGLRTTNAGVTYTVAVNTATLPPGVNQTVDPDGTLNNQSTSTLTTAAPTDLTRDFGYRGPGSIGDTIFLDVNNNGLPDAGEGIAGVTVTLTGDLDNDGSNESVTATTDTNGLYLFSGLVTNNGSGGGKTYTVAVNTATLPAGVAQTVDPDGTLNNQSSSTITTAAPTDLTRDFGYRGPGSIGDTIFLDVNNNGVPDVGEGIANVTVTLTGDLDGDGTSETVTTTTDTNGAYLFSGLRTTAAGVAYTVAVNNATLPAGLAQTVDPDGTLNNQSTSTLTTAAPTDLTRDFGYRGPGSVGDTIFLDVNNNGVPDAGEGIANVTVTLTGDLDGDGVNETVSATTDTNGLYLFSGLCTTAAGVTYTVAVNAATLPPGVAQTVDPDGTLNNQSTSTLTTAAPTDLTRDFGYRGPGSIGDTIFLDVNNNGLPDVGEGIANVTVTLTGDLDGDGTSETVTTTTDTNGAYLFSGLRHGGGCHLHRRREQCDTARGSRADSRSGWHTQQPVHLDPDDGDPDRPDARLRLSWAWVRR
ncbi:MAG: SdrD B-like domain-containing protein [Gemmataceae bacterium]